MVTYSYIQTCDQRWQSLCHYNKIVITLPKYLELTHLNNVLCLEFNDFQFLGILKPSYNSVDLTEVEHVDDDSIIIGHSDPGVIEVGEITVVIISQLWNILQQQQIIINHKDAYKLHLNIFSPCKCWRYW